MSLSFFIIVFLFTVTPGNAQKKKKQEETVGQSSAKENAEVAKKFSKKTKIPQQTSPQPSKAHSSQSQQSGSNGTPVKRGRKAGTQGPKILKKKPENVFVIDENFKSGYQSDARSLASPKDNLVNYRLIVNDKKYITFINNQYYFNEEWQKVPTIFFTSVYYEKPENLADPLTDNGRREIHVKFSPKEYPLIMKAMREIKAKNMEIFKNIPDDDYDLETLHYEEEEEDDEEYYEEADEADVDESEEAWWSLMKSYEVW